MSLVYAFIFRLFSWSRVGAEILAADFVFSQIIAIRIKFLSVPAVGFLVVFFFINQHVIPVDLVCALAPRGPSTLLFQWS